MDLVASYALLAAGMLVLAEATLRVMMKRLSYELARTALLKLLHENPQRVEKLLRAAPGTFFDAPLAAIESAKLDAATKRDEITVRAITHPAFDAVATRLTTATKRVVVRGHAGLVLAGGGLVLAGSDGKPPMPLVVLTAVAVIATIPLRRLGAATERSLRQARTELLPEIDKVFIEGRYTG